jgi:hypothetical protein
MSAEARERMLARGGRAGNGTGGRGGNGSGSGGRGTFGGRNGQNGGRGGRQGGAQEPAEALTARNPQATTIDALFGPLPAVESRGRVFVYANKQMQPLNLRLGITDGQATELIEGDLEPGMELVTNVIVAAGSTRPQGGAFPPFMGPQGGRGPGGGRGDFGGGNRGGGGGGNRGGGR